jgi:NAD(P)-dependent dehydrogenase (short-subunit alcohol dehydrogenase family)
MRGLRGRRILVAGSASGIGAATAVRLGEEGARVVLGDVNEDGARAVAERITAAGGSARALRFDLVDPASIDALVSATVEHLGGLDGVANVAADTSPATILSDVAVLDMDVTLWEHTLRANLIGFAVIAKHAVPHLVEAGGGSVVNVSSGAAWGGEDVRPAYAASKAGVNTLTRHLAKAYGKQGVRANSVAPGAVFTEAFRVNMGEEAKKWMLATAATNRIGYPEDLANTIVYLLSDDAEWVTGQVWSVNGGSFLRE